MKDKLEFAVIDKVCMFGDTDLKFNAGQYRAKKLPHIDALRIKSRRYMFTDEASRRAGEITKRTEGHMLRNHQFARGPNPVTYLEINLDEFHSGADMVSSAMPWEGDVRVGFLSVERGDRTYIYVFADNGPEDGFSLSPFYYIRGLQQRADDPQVHLITDGRLQDALNQTAEATGDFAIGPTMFNHGLFLMGSSASTLMTDQRGHEAFTDIALDWAVRPAFDYPEADPKFLFNVGVTRACIGDVRNWMSMMLLLNQPGIVTFREVGHQNRLVKGKRRVYMKHSTVQIELGRRKISQRLFKFPAGGWHPRRHSVRGYFRHLNKNPSCIHDWPTEATISNHGAEQWECSKCGCLRSWVPSHDRGDAGLGYVTKDYEVT